MGEVVNVVVAFAVIILILRWATTSSGDSTAEQAAARALRFRPKKVTPEMARLPPLLIHPAELSDVGRNSNRNVPRHPKVRLVQHIKGTHVGEDLTFGFHSANIHYDLLRTGSVELTTNKILERGFLDVPPEAYFTLYPRQSGADVVPRPAGAPITARTTMAATQARPKETLISRYGLESRLPNADVVPSLQQGGGAVWEDTAEKREASLRERKAQMVLAARQRMLAAQQIPANSPTS
ncbi:hypothetical protein BJV77DRAFT_993691 [Russula vinacea]|nr:hypothetical protein BJV77DRAFT_993691 [Russula vinacea]